MEHTTSNRDYAREIRQRFAITLTHFQKSTAGFSGESYRAYLDNKVVFLRISEAAKGLAPENTPTS